MTIDEMIAVLTHFKNGGKVECRRLWDGKWIMCDNPTWGFDVYPYRAFVEPVRQPKVGDIILARYSDEFVWVLAQFRGFIDGKPVVLFSGDDRHEVLNEWRWPEVKEEGWNPKNSRPMTAGERETCYEMIMGKQSLPKEGE